MLGNFFFSLFFFTPLLIFEYNYLLLLSLYFHNAQKFIIFLKKILLKFYSQQMNENESFLKRESVTDHLAPDIR